MTHDVLMIRSLFASGSEFVDPRQRNTESEPTLTHCYREVVVTSLPNIAVSTFSLE